MWRDMMEGGGPAPSRSRAFHNIAADPREGEVGATSRAPSLRGSDLDLRLRVVVVQRVESALRLLEAAPTSSSLVLT